MEGRVTEEAMEKITERLSLKEDLYYPRSVQQSAAMPQQRKILLFDLLSRDAAVFLERYGVELTCDELNEFDSMGDDYEVNWHLKNLRSTMSPSSEELRLKSVRIRNRRQAFLERMVSDGSYFSEDAMREREPYLHHEMVGKFQDPTARAMPRPGERWSETLMRRCEEASLLEKIREEQRRLGVAETDIVGNDRGFDNEEVEQEEVEEEEEEDEEESNGSVVEIPDSCNATQSSREISSAGETTTTEDMADRMDQFTYVMHQKFLTGEDHKHLDYSKIDDDETLDDHWLKEVNLDAEDRYFAGVED